MIRNIVKIILTVFCIWEMLKFSMPKLLAYDISVRAFSNFGEAYHINGAFFMYFTGVVELVIAILLGFSLFVKNTRKKIMASLVGNILLLLTMAGAIFTELYVRPGQVNRLLVLGIVLFAISLLQVTYFNSPRRLCRGKASVYTQKDSAAL